jgi:uncharacterized protein
MGFDQYHEPPEELPAETRTFARLSASLEEEAQAIGWYQQRLAFKHFSMDLEFLLRRTPRWRAIAKGVLFQDGDIVEHGEAAEAASEEGGEGNGDDSAGPGDGSLGIGSLRGESQ